MGNFQLARIFFFSLTACAGIFFSGEPLCTNFFFRQILLFFSGEILIHYLCFCALISYSTLTTDQRIQATLMQNRFENVHTVRERRKPLGVDGFPVHFFSPCPLEFLSHSRS